MRASGSGKAWRCTVANANALARSSSRSRHARSVAERSTPRKCRVRRSSVIGPAETSERHTLTLPNATATRVCAAATYASTGATATDKLIQLKFVNMAMLSADPADRPGCGSHYHRFGINGVLLEAHTLEQRAAGNAGCGKDAVTSDHIPHRVFFSRIQDAHPLRALAFFIGIEHEPPLHLSADATQSRRRQNTFRRAANAHVDVNSGHLRIGGMNDAGDIAVGNQG